jgi:protein-S-isoprenylcysteine O-methyltransferase Ste14
MSDTEAKSVPDRTPVKRWAKVRLWAGYVYIALAVFFAAPTALTACLGFVLVLLGLAVRFQAAAELTKDTVLTTSGLYAASRHPLYLGSSLIGLGIAVLSGSLWFLLGLVAILAPLYIRMMSLEEKYLTELFPEGYPDYARRVPRFFPKPGLFFAALLKRPEWQRLRTRGELASGILILAAVMAILVWHRSWLRAL